MHCNQIIEINQGDDLKNVSPPPPPPPLPRKNSRAQRYVDLLNDKSINKTYFGDKPSIFTLYDIFTQLTQEVDIIIDKYQNTPYFLDQVTAKLREIEEFIKQVGIDKGTVDQWINKYDNIKELFNNPAPDYTNYPN